MRISQREKAQLGYTHTSSRSKTSFQNPDASSPRTSNRSSDIDFSDVFGGPPRRSGSFQDLQRSSRFHDDEDDDDNDVINGDDGFKGRSSGGGNPVGSTPVFGTEVHSRRRRYPSEDFYDDIFRGDHPSTLSSSPRTGGNPFSSAPGSRVLSPTRPLTLSVEPIGSPAQFSLPARLVSTVHPSSTSYRPSPLSSSKSSNNLHEVPSKAAAKPDGVNADAGVHVSSSSEEDSKRTSSVSSDHNQFHFSIYKWASKGVPLSMSLGSGGTRFKENSGTNKLEKSSLSSNHTEEIETLISQVKPDNVDVDDTFVPAERITKESESKQDEGVSCTPNLRFNDNAMDGDVNLDMTTRKPTSSKKTEVKPSSLNADTDASYGEADKPFKLKESIRLLREQMESFGDGRKVEKENVGRNIKHKGGTVKEFAKFFNQESSVKPKNYSSGGQSRNSARSNVDTSKTGNHETAGHLSKKQAFNVDSGIGSSDMEDGKHVSSGGTVPVHTKDFNSNNDVIDEACISMEERPEIEEKPVESNEDNQILDNKVHKWSKGKEGNIRALLSTLHYVLWPNSGWKPVPLVDIIEAGSVKRSYQRALLCLHPDKLQQKGATSHEKYIAARVFDVLQEAWDQFNSLGSL